MCQGQIATGQIATEKPGSNKEHSSFERTVFMRLRGVVIYAAEYLNLQFPTHLITQWSSLKREG